MSVKGKKFRNIIIAFVVLALLSGAYFLVLKWEPEKEEDTPYTSDSIEIFNIDTENITEVIFKNTYGQFSVKRTGDGENEVWSIPEKKGIKFSAEKLKTGAFAFSKIYAKKKIGGDVSDYKEFGFENEEISVTIVGKDGVESTLVLGSSVLVDDTYYLMKKGNPEIYTVSNYTAEKMLKKPDDFRETHLGGMDISDMDEFTLMKGSNVVMKIERNPDVNSSAEFSTSDMMMTVPYREGVRIDVLVEMLAPLLSSVDVLEFISDDITDKDKYGIDDGYRIDIKKGNTLNTLILGDVTEEDKVYAVFNDNKFIFTMDAKELLDKLKEIKPFDYVQKFAHIYNIDTVKSVDISANGKTYTLLIERSGNGEDEQKSYRIGGRQTEEDKFKKVFQSIIGLYYSQNVEDESKAKDVVCEIVFKLTDGAERKATYREYDERYLMLTRFDGKKYLILKKDVMSMLDTVKGNSADAD